MRALVLCAVTIVTAGSLMADDKPDETKKPWEDAEKLFEKIVKDETKVTESKLKVISDLGDVEG